MARFRDRAEAGRVLAERLTLYAGRNDVVVLGLPRGGVPVAAEVAAVLGGPLDVLVVRKLGVPGHVELAMGAVGPHGVTVRNDAVVARHRVSDTTFAAVRDRELAELQRRETAYRRGRPPAAVAGRDVIVVDDGLATGASMRVAVAALRQLHPKAVVLAVAAGSPRTCSQLLSLVDDVVCVHAPATFRAVGEAYDDFRPTSDDEVRAALGNAGDG